jgi:DNA-directed RNA polymerase subunit D
MDVERKRNSEEKLKIKVNVMEIKKVFEEGTVSKYLVKDTDSTFMNVLRRTIMVDVPCLAVDTIQIYENDSPVVDEMLGNRLGLLPIKTDYKTYKKGNSVKLVIEKTGPCTVTGEDVKASDPKVEVIDKNIIITKLGKGRRIKLEMTAVMDTGENHSKYQPAIVSYNELPIINNDKKIANIKEVLANFPEGIIEEKAGKLVLADPYNIKFHGQHQDLMLTNGIELDYSDKDFVLTVETTGQLTVEEVIASAADTLVERLDELAKEVSKL